MRLSTTKKKIEHYNLISFFFVDEPCFIDGKCPRCQFFKSNVPVCARVIIRKILGLKCAITALSDIAHLDIYDSNLYTLIYEATCDRKCKSCPYKDDVGCKLMRIRTELRWWKQPYDVRYSRKKE